MVLIILILVLFVHWRRRAFLSKHKMDEINHSFQHPFTMPLIKTGVQTTSSPNTETDQKWDFFNNSNSTQAPRYLYSENTSYAPTSNAVMPHFLLQQQSITVPNSLILPNYMRTPFQSNQSASLNQQSIHDHANNGGGDGENRPQMLPFFQTVNSSMPSESNALYTAVSEADPYVNGTPRPNQIFRIPPPPSIPLPPTPTQSHSTAEQMPAWPVSAYSREKDYIQHRELSSSGSGDLNSFYRYSIPLNGAYPATPVYSAPIWVAGTMDPSTLGRFYGQHQLVPQDRQQGTPELNGELSKSLCWKCY